jgi:hypothetical protein
LENLLTFLAEMLNNPILESYADCSTCGLGASTLTTFFVVFSAALRTIDYREEIKGGSGK